MSEASPGRTLGKASTGSMSKSDRKNPSVKKIDNRYPQTRKGGKV
jgi:hypothetical protein